MDIISQKQKGINQWSSQTLSLIAKRNFIWIWKEIAINQSMSEILWLFANQIDKWHTCTNEGWWFVNHIDCVKYFKKNKQP